MDIKIAGSVFVALALFAYLAITTGLGFNEIISGLGDLLIGSGLFVIVVLVIGAIILILKIKD